MFAGKGRLALAVAAATFLPTLGVLTAQEEKPGQVATTASSIGDPQLAAWLITDNECLIAVSQKAVERVRDEDVRTFAQAIIKEHNSLSQMWDKFVPEDQRAALRNKSDNAKSPASAINARSGNPSDWVGLRRAVVQQCLATCQKELDGKSAEQFDKCYLTYAMIAHMQLRDTITVFQRYASPSFKKVLGDAATIADGHLQEAKQLLARFEARG